MKFFHLYLMGYKIFSSFSLTFVFDGCGIEIFHNFKRGYRIFHQITEIILFFIFSISPEFSVISDLMTSHDDFLTILEGIKFF